LDWLANGVGVAVIASDHAAGDALGRQFPEDLAEPERWDEQPEVKLIIRWVFMDRSRMLLGQRQGGVPAERIAGEAEQVAVPKRQAEPDPVPRGLGSAHPFS
jgi:hypothetical protein